MNGKNGQKGFFHSRFSILGQPPRHEGLANHALQQYCACAVESEITSNVITDNNNLNKFFIRGSIVSFLQN